MTRKDYAAIAAIIRPYTAISPPPDPDDDYAAVANGATSQAARIIAHRLADHCAQDNPRFDRARFLAACGAE
jgi:hypothetical protein